MSHGTRTVICWFVCGMGGFVAGHNAPDGEWSLVVTGVALVLLALAVLASRPGER